MCVIATRLNISGFSSTHGTKLAPQRIVLYTSPKAKHAGRCTSTDRRQRPASNGNRRQTLKMNGASSSHGYQVATPDSGIGVLRVGWRRPNDLDLCTLDLLAAADLAARTGAQRFVTGGHSFGGAIAIRAGMAMGDWTRGVVTFATQSAGCEEAQGLTAPLLAYHGDRDEILPPVCSEVVGQLVGGPADIRVCGGAGHLLTEAGERLRAEVPGWIRERLAEDAATTG